MLGRGGGGWSGGGGGLRICPHGALNLKAIGAPNAWEGPIVTHRYTYHPSYFIYSKKNVF